MKKKLFGGIFVLICALLTALEPNFDYKFEAAKDLKLHGNAKIINNILVLDGKNSYAEITGTKTVNLTEKGLTLAALVKFNDSGEVGGENNSHDMIISKGREFIFGRNQKNLYINFHDGAKWAATTMGGSAPEVGEWVYLTAVFENFNDVAQGDVGYKLSIFVNGEPVIRMRHIQVKPAKVEAPILIGSGFGGGPWFFNGEIAEVKIFDSALIDSEVAKLAAGNKQVKIKPRKGFYNFDSAALDAILPQSSPLGCWLINSYKRGLKTGMDAKKLPELKAFASIKNPAELVKKFNAEQKDFKLLLTPQLLALVQINQGSKNFPILGLYNIKHQREVFGERTVNWQVELKNKQKIDSFDERLNWSSQLSGDKLSVTWQMADFKAEADFIISGSRLEGVFKPEQVKNIDNFTFPIFSFAKLGKNDTLLYPWMCGVLVDNPTENQFQFGQEGIYPSGRIPLQFGAYFDDAGGVYYGFEDGLGWSKNHAVTGKYGNLEVMYQQNGKAMNGKAAIEIYDGKWYEAGRIYRKFLAEKAAWWIADLPRQDTPDWFKNNTLWFLSFTGSEAAAEMLSNELKFFRDYFELPIGVHWYNWNDEIKQPTWPHFIPKNFALKYLNIMKKNGVYVKPYIDTRLWALNDGPDFRSDYMYTSHGQKYAVRKPDNSIYTEDYGNRQIHAVMCPASRPWQEWMTSVSKRVTDYGFDAIYHDQVGTARALPCYNRTHGHEAGGSRVWLEEGYWPMFDKIRQACGKVCHDTEENAEPYAKAMDGFMVWRWTDRGQVPLFQSIYSGRVQFTGRTFNHQRPGDRQSFFCKLAQQFVNAEQLGWFTTGELADADEKRLLTKKLMHLRLALLPYFNAGEMLPPVKYQIAPPEVTCKWGGVVTQMVTTRKIADGAWQDAAGNKVFLFVNTVDAPVSVQVNVGKNVKFFRCQEGKNQPVESQNDGNLTLQPYKSEIWVFGPKAEAERIQQTFRKISGFDAGKSLKSTIKLKGNNIKKLSVAPGQWVNPAEYSETIGCAPSEDSNRIGWTSAGALILIGDVDFGGSVVESLELKVGVANEYAGGSIEAIIANPGSPEEVAGTLKLESTGGFRSPKVFTLKLNRKLSGVNRLLFRLSQAHCCDFYSWKY